MEDYWQKDLEKIYQRHEFNMKMIKARFNDTPIKSVSDNTEEIATPYSEKRKLALVEGVVTKRFSDTRFIRNVKVHDLQVVDFDYGTSFHYSFYHCQCFPLVHNLKIRNKSTKAVNQLHLYLEIIPDEFVAASHKKQPVKIINQLLPNETIELENLYLPLELSSWQALRESCRAQLFLRGEDANTGKIIISEQVNIKLLAYNEWFAGSIGLSASYVQSNHPKLHQLVAPAAKRLFKTTGSSAFSGYQTGKKSYIIKMLQACFDEIQYGQELTYINPLPSFECSGQKIRFADDVLLNKCGTCLDLSYFQAGLVEIVGLSPIIVFIPGHAFFGVWLESGLTFTKPKIQFTTSNSSEILSYINQGKLLLINSTEVATHNSFSSACENGKRLFEQTLIDGDTVEIIDINKSRSFGITPLPHW